MHNLHNKPLFQSACQDIIQSLFLSESSSLPSIDTVLDKVVIKTCEELLNDVPARDPRWETRDDQISLGSSYSMQVLSQLEDKQKALDLYLTFLRDVDLWNRLCACNYRDLPLATVYILGELSEKLVAAVALKRLPSSEILEKAITRVVDVAVEEMEGQLSHQDLFYRWVNRRLLL